MTTVSTVQLADRINELERRLQLTFASRKHAPTALVHKSYCNEKKHETVKDNERLEFLGDAVVDLLVGEALMEQHPNASEGELSKLRASIVNEEGLAQMARQISLGELLLLGKGEENTNGRDKSSVLADAFEAVIGAVYLENGIDATRQLVQFLFAEVFVNSVLGNKDYKSILQEAVQSRFKLTPKYRVTKESGPEHEKLFEIEVLVGTDVFARSTGKSKKEAEQAAARETILMLDSR
jgi:ribonuclease III